MAKEKLFRFAKTSGVARLPSRSIRAGEIKNAEDLPPFFIRGQKADSKDEWWAFLALEKIEVETGWGFDYQYSVYGGRNLAHGNVIDFLVYTPGQWTMIEPMGDYWHTGIHEDQGEMEEVARRKNWKLIAYLTSKVNTREKVYAHLRDKMNV